LGFPSGVAVEGRYKVAEVIVNFFHKNGHPQISIQRPSTPSTIIPSYARTPLAKIQKMCPESWEKSVVTTARSYRGTCRTDGHHGPGRRRLRKPTHALFRPRRVGARPHESLPVGFIVVNGKRRISVTNVTYGHHVFMYVLAKINKGSEREPLTGDGPSFGDVPFNEC
jgi:hypothetical protein